MFRRLFHRDRAAETAAAAAYAAIVAQARSPALYGALGVPDSVTGRFEMVVLHAVLVIRRLSGDGPQGSQLGQLIFDDFCRDMDQSLRELGFGDLAVPKRMKKLGESFYGRAEAYGRTLGDRSGLVEAIKRNVFPDVAAPVAAEGLAAYVIASAASLADVSLSRIGEGSLSFPDPAEFVEAAT